jgi:hypothetical protein
MNYAPLTSTELRVLDSERGVNYGHSQETVVAVVVSK